MALRRVSVLLAFLVSTLSLWPAVVFACPPVLHAVTVEPNGNHPTSLWSLPPHVTSQFIETSESSDVNEFGYFTSVSNFNVVNPDQTSFSDPFNFPPGTYYLHVASHDDRCKRALCPSIEFSDVMSFEVAGQTPATAAASVVSGEGAAGTAALDCSGAVPGGTPVPPLPTTSVGAGPDRVAPFQSLSFAPEQDVDRLFVTARMSEAGTLTARASVSVAGTSRTYRFRTVIREVAANVTAKLRLRLAKKRLRVVKRALRKGRRLKAKVRVIAADRAGNLKVQRATIRLED